MSYCNKCGAYIPDGQEVCLACGFDEAAEQRKQESGSAYAYAPKSEEQARREEDARRRAEQRRREQQEMNRKWAEAEARRRQQQEDFRRQQQEAARAAVEWESQRKTNEDGYYRLHRYGPGVDSSFTQSGQSSNSRVFSYLSYISFLCFLPSILGVNDPFTRFHAKQGRKLFFFALVGKILGGIFSFGIASAVIQVLQIVLMVNGLRNVARGLTRELPLIGNLGEQQSEQK